MADPLRRKSAIQGLDEPYGAFRRAVDIQRAGHFQNSQPGLQRLHTELAARFEMLLHPPFKLRSDVLPGEIRPFFRAKMRHRTLHAPNARRVRGKRSVTLVSTTGKVLSHLVENAR